ncbi:methyltransferase domain-containing protein [Streptomyces sp. NPDC003077]|uniref:SAM-dependent methyltransferase n=1 Tax=Streptomyces sp. NPDC003077 TaxID=3154443 RepID=UPI0033A7311D
MAGGMVNGAVDPGHYGADPIGSRVGCPGAGILAYLTRDMLHPPMVDDDAMWADGNRWYDGAAEHVRAVGRMAGLKPGDRVLDIGCGICGPARLLAREYGAVVSGVSTSAVHVASAVELNALGSEAKPSMPGTVSIRLADCQLGLGTAEFDAAVSINMLYQVADHRAMYGSVFRALRHGGCLVLDDWMLTPLAGGAELTELAEHFQFASFARTDRVETELLAAGFLPLELVHDFGRVGRLSMTRHFERVMREHFAGRVEGDWPVGKEGDPAPPIRGDLLVEHFVAAVNVTLRLYARRCLTYRRILVRKPEE